MASPTDLIHRWLRGVLLLTLAWTLAACPNTSTNPKPTPPPAKPPPDKIELLLERAVPTPSLVAITPQQVQALEPPKRSHNIRLMLYNAQKILRWLQQRMRYRAILARTLRRIQLTQGNAPNAFLTLKRITRNKRSIECLRVQRDALLALRKKMVTAGLQWQRLPTNPKASDTHITLYQEMHGLERKAREHFAQGKTCRRTQQAYTGKTKLEVLKNPPAK